jgi:hypothetical protein
MPKTKIFKTVAGRCRSAASSFDVFMKAGDAGQHPGQWRHKRLIFEGEIEMKFMVIVKATKDSEAGVMPSAEMLRAMGQYNEELAKAGVLVSADGLHPSSKGARVRFSGADRTVIDGPFTETKELIAGYWIMETASLEECIAWVRKVPNPHPDQPMSEIEIRQIFAPEDFADIAPDVVEQEKRLMAEAAARRQS